LVAHGKDLYWWHPLVSGDPETVHIAGVSVRGRVSASETDVPEDQLEDYLVSWPMRVPAAARRKGAGERSPEPSATAPKQRRTRAGRR
jgi:hypothetical protein